MSKWLLCSALVLGLGAGAAAIKCTCFSKHRTATAPAPVTPPEPRPVAQAFPRSPTYIPRKPAATVEYLNEPIVTRPESSDATAESVPPLPTVGGAEESEAGVTQAPRPDREMRRMPYADEPEFVDRLFQHWPEVIWTEMPENYSLPIEKSIWSSLARWIWQADPGDSAEESEEPPLLMPFTPGHHHPPHCPYSGHCPYPGPYRYVQPR